mmetsp:Transcript_16321/g.49696  ORF Transcript_16321/g.49696 Transcript_16321/m.49696 type:complete len:87 (-) Transcript_16321:107-367(-)
MPTSFDASRFPWIGFACDFYPALHTLTFIKCVIRRGVGWIHSAKPGTDKTHVDIQELSRQVFLPIQSWLVRLLLEACHPPSFHPPS